MARKEYEKKITMPTVDCVPSMFNLTTEKKWRDKTHNNLSRNTMKSQNRTEHLQNFSATPADKGNGDLKKVKELEILECILPSI